MSTKATYSTHDQGKEISVYLNVVTCAFTKLFLMIDLQVVILLVTSHSLRLGTIVLRFTFYLIRIKKE